MKKLSALLLFFLSSVAVSGTVQVNSVRIWPAPDNTRLVFDLSAPVNYKMFRLSHPERLVIDFKGARLTAPLARTVPRGGLLKAVRSAPRHRHDLRVVLDMKERARYKSYILKPNQTYGYRLVIALYHSGAPPRMAARKTMPKGGLRDLVIAIDAGHGGEDPGAHGPGGTKEKNVVLAIARQLEGYLKQERGMRPVMIRKGDYYLSLRQRTRKARQYQADLFVSIHADAFKDPRVRGTSVYVLSENGASSEAARWLAAKENASDLIGGVSLDDKDDMLASVLLDLSQTATIEASFQAGTEVLKSLGHVGKLHKRRVQQAGFVVLKSPDIPSMLVETAYISNPGEERNLRSVRHQRVMARAIVRGIRAYFARHAPPGTLYAARRYTIARGDTLSGIASRYGVSEASLRSANGLSGSHLKTGQVLRIPAGREG